jgi:hypothetical protein
VFRSIQDEAKAWIRVGNKCLEEVVRSTWQALRAEPGVPLLLYLAMASTG